MENGIKPMSFGPQWKIFGESRDLQKHYDVAVIIPTVGRREIIKSISSVFQQQLDRIQLLIGVDRPETDLSFLENALGNCPKNISANLIYPGYSTSIRHGGLTLSKDGGSMRSVLSQLANSRYIAYLDDDNWWDKTHLTDLLNAIRGKSWAFSLRYFVHPVSKKVICIDDWESVGPDKGIFHQKFGGFVDPNCLMLDKEQCGQCLSLWNIPLKGDPKGMSADRNIFNYLKNHSPPGATKNASVFYVIDPNDGLHRIRLELMGLKYIQAAL